MQISSDKILNKMASEIAKAKGSESRKAKEHLLVVRALCDLLLEEQPETSVYVEPKLQANVITPRMPVQPIASFSGEPVYVKEDDANGSSLLDF
ncbi:YwdI family protein [Bacillus sp. 123MFChir2]|uniref:YwdI family protein n=1 Tax=Bacillus sp. 123MFChir2 TaxID=1169144 RepID=UPI00036AEC51|nr:YwdI family protein [Bacillus sp. 123MFChir2]